MHVYMSYDYLSLFTVNAQIIHINYSKIFKRLKSFGTKNCLNSPDWSLNFLTYPTIGGVINKRDLAVGSKFYVVYT